MALTAMAVPRVLQIEFVTNCPTWNVAASWIQIPLSMCEVPSIQTEVFRRVFFDYI